MTENNYINRVEPEEDIIDIKMIFGMSLARWWWYIISVTIFVSIALFITYRSEPVYNTKGVISIADDSGSSSKGADLMGGMDIATGFSMGSKAIDEAEVLKSTSLMRDVVLNMNLYIEQYSINKYKTTTLYKNSPLEIFVDKPYSIEDTKLNIFNITEDRCTIEYPSVNKTTGEDQIISVDYVYDTPLNIDDIVILIKRNNLAFQEESIVVNLLSVKSTIDNYISKLNITLIDKTNTIHLSLDDASSSRATNVINNLIDVYNRNEIAFKKESGSVAFKFISERLHIVDNQLIALENRLEQFKTTKKLTNIEAQGSLLIDKEAKVDDKVFRLNTEVKVLKQILEFVNRGNKGEFDILPTNVGISEGSSIGNIELYNKMILERMSLLQSAGRNASDVKTLDSQLRMLSISIRESVENSLRSLDIELSQAMLEKGNINRQLSSSPKVQRELRTIERKQKLTESLYLFLMQKKEEASIAMESNSDIARVIEEPFTQSKPVGTDKKIILLIALVMGCAIPLGIIVVTVITDNSVHDINDIKALTNQIPFLGNIIRVGKKGKVDRDEVDFDEHFIYESFSMLRENINFLPAINNSKESPVILVTSAIAGEGKSFTACNLAYNYAKMNKKVLLVGCDLRKQTLHKYFKGINQTHGLSNYLSGSINNPKEIVQKLDLSENLDVISSGVVPPNPSVLINQKDKVSELLTFARENYDIILLDTVPTFLSESFVLSHIADLTLYVMKSGTLPKEILPDIEDMHTSKRLHNMALVFNGMKLSGGRNYKYQYRYQYHYQYKYQ